MGTEYEADSALTTAVEKLLNNETLSEFADIRDADTLVIKSLFALKMNKDDELVPTSCPVSLKKVSPIFSAISSGVSYVLIMDKYTWDHSDDNVRNALLHKALMQICVDESVDGPKFKMRKPDVCEFSATVKRFGCWTPNLTALRSLIESRAAGQTTRLLNQP